MYTLIVFLSMNMVVANNSQLNAFVKGLMESNQYEFRVTSWFTDKYPKFQQVGKFLEWLDFCSDNNADENKMLYETIKAIQEGRMKIDGTMGATYQTRFDNCSIAGGRDYEEGFPENLIPAQQKTSSQQQVPSALSPLSGGSSVSDECNQTYNMQTNELNKIVNFNSNCLKKVGNDVTTLTINPGQNHKAHVNVSYKNIHSSNTQGKCDDAYVTGNPGGGNFCPTTYHNTFIQGSCGRSVSSNSTNKKQYNNNIIPTLNYTIEFIPCNRSSGLADDAIEYVSNSTIFNLTLSLIILL